MANPPVAPISTLGDFTAAVEGAMTDEFPAWYRGVPNAGHTLSPSLFRHPGARTSEEIVELETQIFRRYAERSVPFHDRARAPDDWEQMFVMQHFGVPTRLLDWTENPYVGLFFALADPALDNTGAVIDDAAVWVLKPVAWNRHALEDIGYADGILSIGDDLLRPLAPKEGTLHVRTTPLAMYGVHNSARIVAQRGAFTVFSRNREAMEVTFDRAGHPPGDLLKLVVPAAEVLALRKQLFGIGITDSVIYPDLEGLARELKRFFGFM